MRILLALKARGHVAGFLGDGINDAPSMHAADVGISVDGAVDVAKEAADLVLLEHDLNVVREGRRTFGNVLKYILMGTSSNFGNMFSMAGGTLLPFALWNETAFLAERVLGNVVSSGIKVLVLAVIVGIGIGLFAQFQTPPGTEPSIDLALTIMLASLAMLGLGIFEPGIATGLVSGAPQLGAGAAAGTALGAAGLAVAGGAAIATGGAAVAAGARMGPGAARAAIGGVASAGRARARWPAVRSRPTRLVPQHRAVVVCALLVLASPMWPGAVPVLSASASQPVRKRSRIA
ncbi:MAG: type IV secretion system protein [Gammaproteobacteria bacterium]|nr:type IV secretion system protein [Gammaproteobacteria bacterium]